MDRLCAYCGKPIEHPNPNQKYHIKCGYELAKISSTKNVKRRREAEKLNPKPKPEVPASKKRYKLSRDTVAKRANKEGLTYGQYSVKHRLYPWLQEPPEIKSPERHALTFNEVQALATEAGMTYQQYAKSIGL